MQIHNLVYIRSYTSLKILCLDYNLDEILFINHNNHLIVNLSMHDLCLRSYNFVCI